jgi:NAD(P)-dependent dehydrogenase (short-subunit alcohol dehydrogenase family)
MTRSILDRLFSLEGKTAVVTGAGRGNGKAIAEGLVSAGATVIGIDLFFENDYSTHECLNCDITKKEDLNTALEYIVNKYKTIDILVNNAGVSYPNDFLDYPEDSWDKTYEVNLKAPYELMKMVAKNMKDTASGGSIINITSLNSEMAFPNNPAYVSMKGALKQLTKSASLDLGKYNIRVNNIGPGYFMTEMTRNSWEDQEKHDARASKTVLNRWGKPEDLIGAAVFLASEASSYITGQDIYIDGGWLIKGL